MKVPKDALGVLKITPVKKRNLPRIIVSDATATSSTHLDKKVAPRVPTPNFTLSQLSKSSAKEHFDRTKRTRSTTFAPAFATERETATTEKVRNDKTAALTQVVGMSLALFGLCFAVVFGSGIVQPLGQKAQVVDASSTIDQGAATTTNPLTCSAVTVLFDNKCINPKPAVTFNIPGNQNELHELVPVTISVDYATRVTLSVYSKETHSLIPLGLMQKVSESNYTFAWPTKTYNDGTYYLQAVVENQFGVYEMADTVHPLTLLNFPPVIALATSTSNVSLQATTTDGHGISIGSNVATTTNNLLQVPTMTSILPVSAVDFGFAINAIHAESVKLYARIQPDGIPLTLGYAYRDGDTLWRYHWLATDMQPGKYLVNAYVYRNDGTTGIASTVVTKVMTSASTTLATASTTIPKLLVPDPVVTVAVKPSAPVLGRADFTIHVQSASAVTLYALGTNSLMKSFLGKAVAVDTGVWTLTFDSTTIPDGDYSLMAMVTNVYGTYESTPLLFSIKNRAETVFTADQIAKIAILHDIGNAAALPNDTGAKPALQSSTAASSTVDLITKTADTAIADELIKLAVALRAGDNTKVLAIKADIESLKQQAISRGMGQSSSSDITAQVDAHVAAVVARTETNVATIDKIITERTGEKASLDSDHDGISDFDEVTIYKTNPYAADTDNDGFLDGAEVLSGFDPLSAKGQALVAYESPKDAGVEQKNLLAVTSITTAVQPKSDATTSTEIKTAPGAVISGTAPANSFVTLFIFSTPIIITIKTDSDGGWNYHFDKELENGVHQVYVGVTDNAGKIVAKSVPFTFIKTAEAYSGQTEVTNEVTAPVPPVEHNLLSMTILYVIGGLTILMIGLVLLLIGARLDNRKRLTATSNT